METIISDALTEINEIVMNKHYFRVKPISEWHENLLTRRIILPGINYNHRSNEQINFYYDFINSRIIDILEVDFYSENEKYEFKIMSNKLRLFSIHFGLDYEYYGQIIENVVNDVFEYYLLISIK